MIEGEENGFGIKNSVISQQDIWEEKSSRLLKLLSGMQEAKEFWQKEFRSQPAEAGAVTETMALGKTVERDKSK